MKSKNQSESIERAKLTRQHNALKMSLEAEFIELERISMEKYSMDLETLLLGIKEMKKLQRA